MCRLNKAKNLSNNLIFWVKRYDNFFFFFNLTFCHVHVHICQHHTLIDTVARDMSIPVIEMCHVGMSVKLAA